MCSLFFERFVLFFCLKIERFVPETTEIWICGLYGVYAAHYSISTPSSIAGARYAKRDAPRGTQWDVGYNASVSYRINPYMRLHAFGQYSGYGRSNSFHGYMNPMYPQSGYGMVLELKVTDWLDLNGGLERSYDPTKMKWVTSPVFAPTIRIKK